MFEIDHVFVCVDDPSRAIERLNDHGLKAGTKGRHPGQGTASACVYFTNAYLELLWPDEPEMFESSEVRPFALGRRFAWRSTGGSPFGISLRSADPSEIAFPFVVWRYSAPFLPQGAIIPVVTPPFRFREPLVFISLVPYNPAGSPTSNGMHSVITGVTVRLPDARKVSSNFSRVCEMGVAEGLEGREALLELELDHRQSGEVIDSRYSATYSTIERMQILQ